MYFSQVKRNASKNRKDNGLLFGSLIVAIVAFYTLLSLESQDVMVFLKTTESDAVSKLMLLIPYVYGVSLFFVFFLIYFSHRYQLDRRRREFGIYLMCGMKRGRLWVMLMGESLLNSILALAIGIPIALFLTEAISLVTAKLIGIGFIGHTISFSPDAIIWTAIGFLSTQFVAMLFLSGNIAHQEPLTLLSSDSPIRQILPSKKKAWIYLCLGILFLVSSYILGIQYMPSFDIPFIGLTLLLLGAGTFLLFRGLGTFIGNRKLERKRSENGLQTFTRRQLQESVLSQYKAMAVSSLLLFIAITCISYGIGTASGSQSNEVRSVDFSIVGDEAKVKTVLETENTQQLIASYYPMYLSLINSETPEDDPQHEGVPVAEGFSWTGLTEALESLASSEDSSTLVDTLSDKNPPYLIKESSYNALLISNGIEPLELDSREVALFSSFNTSTNNISLNDAIDNGASIEIGYENYRITHDLQTLNIVADSQITLFIGIIVPDELYDEQASDPMDVLCWNVMLKEEVVDELGLIAAISSMDEILRGTGLEYESYLSGIGRNLFYTVGGSYLTIYLGVLFIIIANTVIGLKLLIHQRESRHRYRTLFTLGAQVKEMCSSARSQIRIFFGLVIVPTAVSSVFAIWALFSSILRLPDTAPLEPVIIFSVLAFVGVVGIQCAYVFFVNRVSDQEIESLQLEDGSNVA